MTRCGANFGIICDMEKVATDIYTFSRLREDGFTYVDKTNGLSDKEAFDKVVEWYDGYKFHPSAQPVINPVSLGMCFGRGEFANYWSQTAMPTFLVDILRSRPLDFSDIEIEEADLGNYEPDNPKGVTLLFQTGYLTIKSFVQMGASRRYGLKLPNVEVENSFLRD